MVRLDRLDIVTPTGRVVAEGALRADPAAPAGAAGHVDLTITGLDEMISAATSAARPDQGGGGLGVSGGVMFLTMLKSMAQREAGADGKPIDRLEVVLTPAGNILLNGQPLGRWGPSRL